MFISELHTMLFGTGSSHLRDRLGASGVGEEPTAPRLAAQPRAVATLPSTNHTGRATVQPCAKGRLFGQGDVVFGVVGLTEPCSGLVFISRIDRQQSS